MEMRNGSILASSLEFLGGFAAYFLNVATCSSSACLELFHWQDVDWKPAVLRDWEPAVHECDGDEGELEVKPQVGSLHGSCVEFKYTEYKWELGHSKCKVGEKKEE